MLKHFETLVGGKPFYDNIRFDGERFQEDEYTLSGNGTEIHIPRFTYHGLGMFL